MALSPRSLLGRWRQVVSNQTVTVQMTCHHDQLNRILKYVLIWACCAATIYAPIELVSVQTSNCLWDSSYGLQLHFVLFNINILRFEITPKHEQAAVGFIGHTHISYFYLRREVNCNPVNSSIIAWILPTNWYFKSSFPLCLWTVADYSRLTAATCGYTVDNQNSKFALSAERIGHTGTYTERREGLID